MGGRLAKQVIDPRIKPGTRAHRLAMLNLAGGVGTVPLDTTGDEPDDPEAEATVETDTPSPAVHGALPPDAPDAEGKRPWDDMTTHARIDDYVSTPGIDIVTPETWDRMTVKAKKAFLDGIGDEGDEESDDA
jgi:hypothetical protein